MKIKSVQVLLALLVSTILCGCSTTYTPSPVVPRLADIPDIPAGTSIALINAQPATDKVNISQSGITIRVYANLHDWTDMLIASLNRTLQKKGMMTTASANKTLKIAITKAILSLAGGGWTTRTTIICTVDTGDGRLITLGGDDTGLNWRNGCEGAMQNMVITIFNDERIQKFLASP